RRDVDGAAGLRRAVLADHQRALECAEVPAHRGDAHVLDLELHVRVCRIDGPGAGRDSGLNGAHCEEASSLVPVIASATGWTRAARPSPALMGGPTHPS